MRIPLLLILFYFTGGQLISQSEKLLDADEITKRIDEAYALVNKGETTDAVELLEGIIADSEVINYGDGMVRGAKGLITLYNMQGDYEKVISAAESVENNAKGVTIYGELASITLYKGMAYLNLGFSDLARAEFKKASITVGKMKEGDGKHYVKALVFDNIAAFHNQMKSERDSILFYTMEAVAEVEKIDEFGKLADAKHSQLAFQYSNLGEIYSKSNEPENAENYFLKALSFYDDGRVLSQRDKIILYSEMGGFYSRQKRFGEALKFLQSALEMEKKTSLPEIRGEIYNYLSEYYLETGDVENSKEFMTLFKTLADSMDLANRRAVNENINRIVQKSDSQKQKEKKRLSFVFLVVLGGILILIIAAWLYRERQLHKRYKQIIGELKKEGVTDILTSPDAEDEVKNSEEVNFDEFLESDSTLENLPDESAEPAAPGITDKTYAQILKNLEKFEKSNRFIKSDISLPFLVNYVDSNSKYLSLVLKNEKKKSFNQYINDLRIDYLIRLLYSQSKYREYKIESLSEEVGFQSRSSFINSFKKKTGITPSYFIKKLKEELN